MPETIKKAGLAAVAMLGGYAIVSGVAQPFLAMLATQAPAFVMVSIVGLFAYWFLDEADDADDKAEAVMRTGERAEDATGGFVDAVTATVFLVLAVAMALFGGLLNLAGAFGATFFAGSPVFASNVITIVLGFVTAATGMLPVPWFIAASVAVLFTAAVYRRRKQGRARPKRWGF